MRFSLFLMLLQVCGEAGAHTLVEEYYRRAASSGADDRADLTPLLTQAEQLCDARPEDSQAWLTVGVIRAAYAKGLGAKGLDQLKQARDALERSIALDAGWRDSYAKAFLARLYMTVPPWPIAFGSNNRAAVLLGEALDRHPASLPGNLYEGLRLLDRGKREEAAARLKAATTATLDCDCPSWTGSLQAQARKGLETVFD